MGSLCEKYGTVLIYEEECRQNKTMRNDCCSKSKYCLLFAAQRDLRYTGMDIILISFPASTLTFPIRTPQLPFPSSPPPATPPTVLHSSDRPTLHSTLHAPHSTYQPALVHYYPPPTRLIPPPSSHAYHVVEMRACLLECVYYYCYYYCYRHRHRQHQHAVHHPRPMQGFGTSFASAGATYAGKRFSG